MKRAIVLCVICALVGTTTCLPLGTAVKVIGARTSSRHPVHREAIQPLNGNLLPLAIFYTTVQVGTPARTFNVSIDTGSTDLLVPLAGCAGCKEGTEVYDPQASKGSGIVECNKTLTCSKCQPSPSQPSHQQCAFSDSYLTCNLKNLTDICTVSGVIYHDTVSVAGISASDVRFGGINHQTTNFDQFKQIDGILGLAYRGDSMGFDDSPFQRLVDQNEGLENVIQTCLTPHGGLLVLGNDERDKEFYNGTLQWSPITLEAWYTVNASALLVRGERLPVSFDELNGPFPDDPCIVDSGTNFLSLTAAAFQAVVNAFAKMCDEGIPLKGVCGLAEGDTLFDGKAFALSQQDREVFPEVEIDLIGMPGESADVKLPIGPKDYFVELPDGTYRLGITNGDCILGNTHMLRYWTVYDRANKRMGFAPLLADKCVAEKALLLENPEIE